MKQTVQMKEVQERMKAGAMTRDGFLGDDTRSLEEILLADDAEVKRLGITHEAIADRLEELKEKGMKGLGDPVTVKDTWEVRVETYRAKLTCPFGESGLHRKTWVEVIHLDTGETFVYTDLSIHLIREHGFYQGDGAAFRLDPALLGAVLELESESTED